MKSNELRKQFLEFFKNKGHTIVASSPLLPANDPTLLFTNAGMVQFKDVFLGQEKRSYRTATSSQRCVRAGGKHNDLENVGYTARHHTFFEMLGNFSFGDYFKREAIAYAWEFITKVLQIPPEKLWVTVYKEDQESEDIWLKEMKIDPSRFSRCDEDNFWSMGETGPCGPCTEIFYDHGPEIAGGPPGTAEADGDRYIEIWNLVFMQYERYPSGELKPLPAPSVDTGMGLERTAAVLQGVHNNYDTDLFQPLIQKIKQSLFEKPFDINRARVIADHIRSSAFLITDGIIPSNEGRGYVLRRIIRRAIRHGHKLGFKEAFFYKLVPTLVNMMGEAYPELKKAEKHIEKILLQEEQQFIRTLETGLKLLEDEISNLKDNIIPGRVIFKLYDTYGFPLDLTADIARERRLTIDTQGFEQAMAEQREKSLAASKFGVNYTERLAIEGETSFTGYERLAEEAKIIALICDNQSADSLQTPMDSLVILDQTPFYAEGGGQVGDQGWIYAPNGQFQVKDTRKEGSVYLHYGQLVQGTIQVGDKVRAEVDSTKRVATALNHTATHLLHAALRKILGEHVMQKGSLVAPDRLRFDFTHYAPLTQEQIREIEELVNQQIRLNITVETMVTTPEAAKQSGALAFFGDKYGEKVRMLAIGSFSKELCGGTHVKRTGDIGLCKIILESGIAAGVRRIEAVTGEYALKWVYDLENLMDSVGRIIKAEHENILERANKIIENNYRLEKQISDLQNKLANVARNDLMEQVIEINGIKVLIAELKDIDIKGLRELVDQLKNKLGSAIIVLGSIIEKERIQLVAGVTKDLLNKVSANALIKQVAHFIGGKGGGRDDFAQAGGIIPEGFSAVKQTTMANLQTTLS